MLNTSEYRWIPRQEIDRDALERMRSHFRKPLEPMGESWFMSEERRMFHELMAQSIEDVPIKILSKALTEISTGISCFGHRQEWTEWFQYLLPSVIDRGHELAESETRLIQQVVTTFISIYWTGIAEEYPEFRADVIHSLSVGLMVNALWRNEDENTEATYPKFAFEVWQTKHGDLRTTWNARKADRDFSAVMVFCLKYLKPIEIFTWLRSCITIADPYWKGAFLVWLLGIFDVLSESIVIPRHINEAIPKIRWNYSHTLGSVAGSINAKYPPIEGFNDNKDFLPSENVQAFRQAVYSWITDELIIEWAALFALDPFLFELTYDVPEALLAKISGD